MSNVKIGWGESDIVFHGGKIIIAGQVPFRAVSEVHDQIKATAMVIQAEARRVIWVSCDFCHPSRQVEDKLAEILHKRLPDFQHEQLILSSTHATAGFYLSDCEILNCGHLLDDACDLLPFDVAREQFCTCAADAVMAAVDSMEHEDIEVASIDILTGFCRRTVHKNGNAIMYGNVNSDDFVRMEYPDGSETKALYFYEKGTRNLRAILAAAPCPAQADESSAYLTADFWGYARNRIKQCFGEKVKLLPLCRAAGELSPHRLFALNQNAEWGQAAAQRLGEWVGENLISFASKPDDAYACENLEIQHSQKQIDFPARKISDEQYRQSCEYLADENNYRDDGRAIDWIVESNARHMKLFTEGKITEYRAKASVVMLGKTIFFTAPAELYTEYAKRVIAKFKGCNIIDIQLTHDSIGYLPTEEAIAHGGYSTSHFSALCDGIGGELYVSEMIKMINLTINGGKLK